MRALASILVLAAACGGGDLGNAPKRLRTAIEAQQDMLNTCYGKTVARSADAAGKMALVIKVQGGQVTEVNVTSSEIDDAKLGKCITGAIKKVQLDPPAGADFDVDYTVQFKLGNGDG
jgi:hypothetical protein